MVHADDERQGAARKRTFAGSRGDCAGNSRGGWKSALPLRLARNANNRRCSPTNPADPVTFEPERCKAVRFGIPTQPLDADRHSAVVSDVAEHDLLELAPTGICRECFEALSLPLSIVPEEGVRREHGLRFRWRIPARCFDELQHSQSVPCLVG